MSIESLMNAAQAAGYSMASVSDDEYTEHEVCETVPASAEIFGEKVSRDESSSFSVRDMFATWWPGRVTA